MMMKFFFLSSLAYLYPTSYSSVMPQCDNFEAKRYDDYGLISAYRRYLNKPNMRTYSIFESCVKGYYKQSPIDSLKLSERYQNDWVFKVVFWYALEEPCRFIDPTTITPAYYHSVPEWIIRNIRKTFLSCSCSDELKFKTELEIISQLIKMAEKAASKLKSLGNNDKFFTGLGDLVAIWKYLIRSISIDLDNKTIDYFSLSRTINEICSIIKTDSTPSGPSLRLSKRYALFWFNVQHIYVNKCTEIFETHHHL